MRATWRLGWLCSLALGCGEATAGGACETPSGAPLEVRVAERGTASPLDQQTTLSVFEPPQGGVATELDVTFVGITLDDLENVRVEVVDPQGVAVAVASFFGSSLPLECNDDASLLVRSMPIPFNDGLLPDALDGTSVTVRASIIRDDGETAAMDYAVTLAATEY